MAKVKAKWCVVTIFNTLENTTDLTNKERCVYLSIVTKHFAMTEVSESFLCVYQNGRHSF